MSKEEEVKKALENMKKYTNQKTTEKESKVSEALNNMQTSVNNYNNTLSEINRLQNAANYPSYNDQVIALQNKTEEEEQKRLENMTSTQKFLSSFYDTNNVNYADSPNAITAAIGRYLGQTPTDKGSLLKIPENIKDNNRRFEDGYQFGDIIKTLGENFADSASAIGSTLFEAPVRIAKGVLSVPENIANAGASLIAGGADLIGHSINSNQLINFSNQLRKQVATGTPFTTVHNALENSENALNRNSFSGGLLDSATEGIGQTFGQLATSMAIGKAGIGTKMGEVPIKVGNFSMNMPITALVTGVGSSASETYAQAEKQLKGIENSSWREKVQMALKIAGGGTIEGFTEGLFGLMGVGRSSLGDKITNKLMSGITDRTEKIIANILISGGGEAAEELISYIGNWLWDNKVVDKFGNLKLGQEWNAEDMWNEMLSAFISSSISQGSTNINQINKLTDNAIQVAEYQQKRNLTNLEKQEIRNQMTNLVIDANEELQTINMYPEQNRLQDQQTVNANIQANRERLRQKGYLVNEDNSVSGLSRIDQIRLKHGLPARNIQATTSQNTVQNTMQNNAQKITQMENKNQNLVPNNSSIQGLEDYTEQDIKDMVADHIQDIVDAKINNITLRQENGTLQAVVESDTDLSEIEPLEVEGNKINIVDSMVFEPRIEYEGQTNIDLDNPTVTAKTEQTTNNDIKQVKIDELPKQDNKVTPTKIVQKAEQTNKTVTQKEQVKNTGKIDDFGEKIGGARKDLWQGTSRHATKEVTHNYSIARDTVTEDGKDNTSYSVKFKGKTLQDGFKTEQEAQEFIDKFKDVLKSNSASVKEFTTKDSNGNPKTMYEVIITDPKTLKKRYTGKEFSSKEEAESYAIALSMYLSEHGKNLFRPTIQKIERTNPNLKNSTKVTGQEILDTFKFRAGEFGNWVSNAERQKFLNYGYDALQDLATALDILPEDLSYGGKMAIAFGARGKGFSGALAHFEPVKKVINMTRLKGAGSLAHEMGHGLDNYLSQLSGYDKDGLLSENERYNNLPNSVKEAFKTLIDSIEYNISTNQEEIDKKNNIFEKRRLEALKYHLSYYDKLFDGKATRYKKIKGKYEQVPITVTEEQKKNYERIKDILISGKLDSKRDYSLENVRGSRDLKGVVTYSEPLETLRTMIKQLTGSKANDDTIYSLYRNGQQAQQVTEVRSKSAFSKAAEELDKATGRASPYFSKIAEKIARSFEAFVNDELKKKGIENTYLVHSVYNDNYALFNPYPAGEERKAIDKAWRNLIDTMKEEGIFHDSDSDMLAFEDRAEYNPDILKEENANYDANGRPIVRTVNKENLNKLAKELKTSASFIEANIGNTIEEAKFFLRGYSTSFVQDYMNEHNLTNRSETIDSKEFQDYLDSKVANLFDENSYDPDEVMEEAIENHGTTDDYSVGAYMTLDGQLLDFDYGGYRDDHRTISVFDMGMQDFMNYGAIRMQPESNGFELATEPTDAQYDRLSDYIENYLKPSGDDINIDIDLGGRNNYDSVTYSVDTPTERIINDLKYYFKNGKFKENNPYIVREENTPYNSTDNTAPKVIESTGKLQGNKPIVEGERYWEGFKKNGYIDLTGKEVRDTQDLAELSQIFRNPLYETFRIAYMKGETIVGTEAISSKIAGNSRISTEKDLAKTFYKMQDRMKRLGADGYYMLHNHPTGVANPSNEDVRITGMFDKNVKGLKGHVVIDHGTYGTITKGLDGNMVVENAKKVDSSNSLYHDSQFQTKVPNNKVPYSNLKISNRDDIAALAYNIKNSDNYSSLILADPKLNVNAIIDIPNNFFNMSKQQVEGYIRNVAKQYGANRAFIATKDTNIYEKSKQLDNLVDVVQFVENDKTVNSPKQKEIFKDKDIKAYRVAEENVPYEATTDSEGNKLSKEQQERFKNSKIRDEQGRLLVMYHGTNAKFTVFDANKSGKNYGGNSRYGKGFYFAPTKDAAENWSKLGTGEKGKVITAYLNITNPFYVGNENGQEVLNRVAEKILKNAKDKTGEEYTLFDFQKKNGYYLLDFMSRTLDYTPSEITNFLEEMGFDGISGMLDNNTWGEVVAFYPEQIKDITNKTPTDNPDILKEESMPYNAESKEERAKRVRKYIEETQKSIGTLGAKVSRKDIVNRIIDNYGITTRGNSKELNRVSKEIQDLIQNGGLTDGKIEGYAQQLIDNLKVTIDDYYNANKELKELIRRTKLYVSDNVKAGFGDFNDFKKQNIGTIRMTNDRDALPVDTFYQELAEVYGETFFPSDIVNASDQLEKIAEVASQIKKIDKSLRENIEENFGEEAREEIVNGLVDNFKTLREKATQLESTEETEIPQIKNRSWTKTATSNDLVNQFLNVKDLEYVVRSNKGTIYRANERLTTKGYEDSLKHFEAVVESGSFPTVDDIALGERLIQESIKKGDFEKAEELIADVTILGTELGQSVQAMSIIKRLSPAGQLMYLQKAVKRINEQERKKRKPNKKKTGLEKIMDEGKVGDTEIKIPDDLRNAILSAQTPEDLQKAVDRTKEYIASQLPVTLTDKLTEWRYLMMLGNPKTHVRNTLGNFIMKIPYGIKNEYQRVLETMFDSQLEERTATFKKATKVVKDFANKMIEENREGLAGTGYSNIQSELKDLRKIYKSEIINSLEAKNSKWLEKEDFFFKRQTFRNVLAEYLTANGIKTEADIKANPELVQKAINYAIEEAKKATFNQYNAVATAISRLENSTKAGKILVGGIAPFKRTPLNIVKTAWQYSPAGLAETILLQTNNLRNGLITPNEYIDRMAQGLTGVSITLVGMLLAALNLIKGSLGNKKKDKYEQAIGLETPYSIKVGDKSFDVSWISPSAVPLLMGVEIYNGLKDGEWLTWDDAINVLEKSMNPISKMSMLSTVDNAVTNYGGEGDIQGIAGTIDTVLKSYISQAFPTLGGQINRILDPTIRSTATSKNSKFKFGETVARQSANKIPFASYALEPSLDIWGNEKKRSDDMILRAMDALINPANITKDTSTEVDNEILRLYDINGNTDVIPKTPAKYFKANSVQYDMSASEYTEYRIVYGQTSYENLEKLFSSSEYKKMSDTEKETAIQHIYDEAEKLAKADFLTNRYGNKEGMEKLLSETELKKVDAAKEMFGFDYKTYLKGYYAQTGVEGEKDKNGKTINGSVKKNKIETLKQTFPKLTNKQAEDLYKIYNGGL